MPGLNNFQEDTYEDRFQSSFKGFLDRFITETVPKNKNIIFALILFIIGGIYWSSTNGASNDAKIQTQRDELGKALILGDQGKLKEQAAAFDIFLAKSGNNEIIQAKASLYRANLHYSEAEYDQALDMYSQVLILSGNQPILSSAAELGAASTQIQLKKYEVAKTALKAFIVKYSQRSEDPAIRLRANAKDDIIPTVPSAMWKLALVQKELGDITAAKELCAKIINVYGDSNESKQAARLVETL